MNTAVIYLEETVKKYPKKTAIIDESRKLSFEELKYNSMKISLLIDAGSVNRPIAVFLPKSINSIECFLGIMYSGNFYVPLDVKSPLERVNKVIENLSPEYIFTNTEYERLLEKCDIKQGIKIINIDEVSDEVSDEIFDFEKRIDTDPIYCIYTSGSTGTPKGVVIPHRAVIDYINWASDTYQVTHENIIGNQAPFHFDNSTLDIFLMLKTGATLVLIPDQLFMFPYKLIDYLNVEKINFIFWVPSVLNMILKINLFKDILPLYLQKVLFAGEVMPIKTLNYWKNHLPNIVYSNLYGPTEITVDCTFYIVDREFQDNELLPIGQACRNSDIIILNDRNECVSKGEIGELCVRGSSLALGYWNDFEKTRSVFVQNPLNTHYPELIYRTGDLVKYNDKNEILYMGRKDTQIKHMGYRIELGEIESAVMSIDGVDGSCALYNTEINQIILIVESINESINEIYIKNCLVEKLPKYMVPHKMYKVDKIPLNNNGKMDRVLLKNNYIVK